MLVSLFAAFFVVLGTAFVLCFKYYKARYIIHCGWCVYCLVMVLGFALACVLHPMLVISSELCIYSDLFLNNE